MCAISWCLAKLFFFFFLPLLSIPFPSLPFQGEVNSDEGLEEIIKIKNDIVQREESCLVELVVSASHILCTAVIDPFPEGDDAPAEDEDDGTTMTMSMEDLQLAFYRPFNDVARVDRINSTWVALTFSPDPVALYSPEPSSYGAPPDYGGGGDGDCGGGGGGNDDPLGYTINIFALETEDEAMALCLAISTAVIESDHLAQNLPDNLTTAL